MRRLFTIMALLMIPVLAFGQARTTARISGTVTDESGNPVGNARVTLISPSMQGERVTQTDANGQFLASLLPVGNYGVTIAAPGMQSVQITLPVSVGQTTPLEIVIKAGSQIEESVVVYGTASPLETTTLGANFNYDKDVLDLPILNRGIEDVARFAPNITFGPTGGANGESSSLAIAGAPSFDTTVLLDGAEVSDPYFGGAPTLFLEDAIEEVQVLTSGVSARYGRFQGGVINAITKTGGNTFDGTVRADFQREDWNSRSPENEVQSGTLQETYQATVGGYVLKDRLWFLAGGRTIPTDEQAFTTVGTGQSFTRVADEDRWQLKLKGAFTPNHVLEVSHLDYERTQDNRAGLSAGDIRAIGSRTDPREITTVAYQGVLSAQTFLDVQGTTKEVSINSGGDPAKGVPFFDFDIGAVYHNHWWDATDASIRDNDTLGASATHVMTSGDWGTHTIEAGAQYVKSTTGGENRQSSFAPPGRGAMNLLAIPFDPGNVPFVECNRGAVDGDADGNFDCLPGNVFIAGDGEVRYNINANDQLHYRWEALPLGGQQQLENLALFVQDTWEYGKWRFDAGLRWEDYTGDGPFPTFQVEFDDIAPRLGVTYNINPSWQTQATWGKYISRINDGVVGNVSGVGAAPYIQSIYTGPEFTLQTADQIQAITLDDANWGIVNSVTDPSQPTTFLDPGLEPPYANDFNLSLKRALPRNSGSFTVTYTNRVYRNLLDDFIGDDGATTVTLGAFTDTFDTKIWRNTGEAKREYEALTATFDYRPSARWSVGGNWTFSETRGNYEGEGGNQPAIGTSIGDFVRSRPTAAAVPFGLLDEDITHRVRLFSQYRFDFDRAGGLTLGAIGQYSSGTPWERVADVPFNDDPAYLNDGGSYDHFFEGRGNNRFQGWWALDMSARYQVGLYKDLDLWVKLIARNVTNQDELVSFNTSGGSTTNTAGTLEFVPGGNFGFADNEDDYQLPRSYQVSVGLRF